MLLLTKPGREKVPHGFFRIEKFRLNPKTGLLEPRPFEVIRLRNAYVNTGGALLLDKLIGGAGTVFDNANANIGGDSATATTAGMTDLQASSNKLRKAMDATFPSRAGQVMTWRSTFATGDANFVWAEIAIFNASSAGTMLCRIAQAMGTKASGTAWIAS